MILRRCNWKGRKGTKRMGSSGSRVEEMVEDGRSDVLSQTLKGRVWWFEIELGE